MKRFKIAIGVLITAISISSCSGFLDETPDNRTKIDTVEKVGEAITLAYPDATYATFADLSSDNAYDSQRILREDVTNTETFFWDNIRDEGPDTPTFYWNAAYKAIAQANAAIEQGEKMLVDLQEKGKLKEVRDLQGILGEAYIARAYSHFTLVNLFAKAYNPATAASEMGIPYVTEVETVLIKEYDRGTVESTYNAIEEDLLKGLAWIKLRVVEPKFRRYHFNEASGHAFAARFYNYKGDFKESLKYSAIPVDGSTLRDQIGTLSLDSEIVAVRYPSADEPANLLIGTVMSRAGRNAGGRYSFTATVANKAGSGLYSNSTNPFGKEWAFTTLSYTASDMLYIPKFGETFKVTDPTNQIGIPYTNMTLFTTDMVYLDRIEALINENDLASALDMLNVFTRKRTQEVSGGDVLTEQHILDVTQDGKAQSKIDPFYVANLSQTQIHYLEYLSDLRRRDSYLDGTRFFDVRRYGMPVTHEATMGDKRTETLEKDDNRTVFQIPVMAIQKGITPNPR